MKVPIEGLISATRYHYDIQIIEPAQLPVATAVTAQGEFYDRAFPGAIYSHHVSVERRSWRQNRCRDEQAGYPIFDVMRIQKPDFMILLGDIIYSDDRCLSPPNAPGSEFKASTLDQYRAKHRYQHGSPALQRFLRRIHLGNLG